MAASPLVRIHQILPAGPTVTFHLLDDSTGSDTSAGNTSWAAVDRPKRSSYTQWMGTPLAQVEATLRLDGADTNTSIEAQCKIVETWREGNATHDAPVLKLSGPIPLTHLKWVLQTRQIGAALRHPRNGERIQQDFDLTFVQYETTSLAFTSPAKAARERKGSPTGIGVGWVQQHYYVVKAGDTSLAQIAAKVLGDRSRWKELAKLNGIRDPRAIKPGMYLRLPS